MEQRRHYRTLVLSDIHLGTSHSKTEEVSHFLSHVDCDRLILNGDIIDGWHLKKGGTRKWQPRHTRFFKVLMKMMERKGTEMNWKAAANVTSSLTVIYSTGSRHK